VVLFGSILALPAAAQSTPVPHLATLSTPGKAVSGAKELPAEIRGTCFEKGNAEITFVVTFQTIQEADAFFPLSTYEGPDGKTATMQILINRTPKPITFNLKDGAGWFGVKNDFILSIRRPDTWTFLKQAAEGSSIAMTVVNGQKKMTMTFDQPADAIGKFQNACRK